MDDLSDMALVIAAGARDWLTLLFAVLAAVYAWRGFEELRRRHRVFANGDAERVGERTLRLRLRVSNRTASDVVVTRIAVDRPSPAVVAMEAVYAPGPGPIPCHHIVPALGTGVFALLLGSPDGATGPIRLGLRYHAAGKRLARTHRVSVAIDPQAAVAPPD